MAKRRMLSVSLLEADCFYDLTAMTQTLYLHLNLNADDDGLVDNFRSIMRNLKASSRNLSTLIEEGYVIELTKHVIAITHWRQHNQIKSDRYTPTTHKELMSMLRLDENLRYFKASEGIFGDNCAPQDSIDKDSKVKGRIDKSREAQVSTDEVRIGEVMEEKEKKDNLSLSHTYIHSEEASPPSKQTEVNLPPPSNILNLIKLYYMSVHHTTDVSEFISFCEERDWIGIDGESIIENYKKYVDLWQH